MSFGWRTTPTTRTEKCGPAGRPTPRKPLAVTPSRCSRENADSVTLEPTGRSVRPAPLSLSVAPPAPAPAPRPGPPPPPVARAPDRIPTPPAPPPPFAPPPDRPPRARPSPASVYTHHPAPASRLAPHVEEAVTGKHGLRLTAYGTRHV